MQNRPDLVRPGIGEADPARLDERIRQRAYEIYEARGREDNHALEDWLEAKAEVLDTKRKPKAA